jgi:hypothetical protein
VAEPVERRLSPERRRETERLIDGHDPRLRSMSTCQLCAIRDLLAEVDALRAERDTQRVRADLSVELHRQAIEEIADRTAELAMLEAERDAAAPILEAAKRVSFALAEHDEAEMAFRRSASSVRAFGKSAAQIRWGDAVAERADAVAALAALFLPAEETDT